MQDALIDPVQVNICDLVHVAVCDPVHVAACKLVHVALQYSPGVFSPARSPPRRGGYDKKD